MGSCPLNDGLSIFVLTPIGFIQNTSTYYFFNSHYIYLEKPLIIYLLVEYIYKFSNIISAQDEDIFIIAAFMFLLFFSIRAGNNVCASKIGAREFIVNIFLVEMGFNYDKGQYVSLVF